MSRSRSRFLAPSFPEAFAGIDHEDAGAPHRTLLVDHDNARRDTGAVEEVGGEPDDALDQATLDEIAADVALAVTTEEDPVRHDDRTLAGAVEGRDEVQQEGIVSVLGRRDAVLEATEFLMGRIKAVRPGLHGERGIGDGEVEPRETSPAVRELGGGEGCCRV